MLYIEKGKLKAEVSSIYSLDDVQLALDALESTLVGCIVIRVCTDNFETTTTTAASTDTASKGWCHSSGHSIFLSFLSFLPSFPFFPSFPSFLFVPLHSCFDSLLSCCLFSPFQFLKAVACHPVAAGCLAIKGCRDVKHHHGTSYSFLIAAAIMFLAKLHEE